MRGLVLSDAGQRGAACPGPSATFGGDRWVMVAFGAPLLLCLRAAAVPLLERLYESPPPRLALTPTAGIAGVGG